SGACDGEVERRILHHGGGRGREVQLLALAVQPGLAGVEGELDEPAPVHAVCALARLDLERARDAGDVVHVPDVWEEGRLVVGIRLRVIFRGAFVQHGERGVRRSEPARAPQRVARLGVRVTVEVRPVVLALDERQTVVPDSRTIYGGVWAEHEADAVRVGPLPSGRDRYREAMLLHPRKNRTSGEEGNVG